MIADSKRRNPVFGMLRAARFATMGAGRSKVGAQMPFYSFAAPFGAEPPYWVAAFGNEISWNDGSGSPVTITYAYGEPGPTESGYAFRPMTAAEQANIDLAFEAIEAHIGARFLRTDSGAADIRVGVSAADPAPFYGVTYIGPPTAPIEVFAFDRVYANAADLAVDRYIYLHEITHALGLRHSTIASGASAEVALPEDEVQGATLFGDWRPAFADDIQLFDIAALQYHYGPNPETRPGDTVYRPDPGDWAFALEGPDAPLIWDGGGVDAIDLRHAKGPVEASLAPGFISRIDGAPGGVLDPGTFAINHGSVIETLIGSRFDDTLAGNGADNYLDGGVGDDWLSGGGGDDVLVGGEGVDAAVYEGSSEAFLFRRFGDDLFVEGDGVDRIDASIELVRFDDGVVSHDAALISALPLASPPAVVPTAPAPPELNKGGGGADWIEGGRGNERLDGRGGHDTISGGGGRDTLAGGAGRDRLDGGNGRDNVDGGAGRDHISGGPGRDTVMGGAGLDWLDGGKGGDLLTGGSGRDLFLFGTGGRDKVTDFELGRDKVRVETEDIGFADLAIRQTGDGARITGAGGAMTLEEVLAADLSRSDFSFG